MKRSEKMKKTVRGWLWGCALAAVSASASGAGEDLEQCRYNNGRPMDLRVCESLRKAAARSEVLRNHQQTSQREAAERNAEQQRMQLEKDAEDRRLQAERAEAYRAQRELEQAGARKAQQEQQDWEIAQERSAARLETKRKEECGQDYKAISIGMHIERAKRCVAPFKLIGQINRVDGVVSTYRSGEMYAHVMDQKIVSWGR